MKLILSLLFIAFFSSAGNANITADQEYILNHSSAAAQKATLGTLINRTRGLLIGKYSFAVQGGTTTSNLFLLTDLTSRSSYAQLPSGAIVTDTWIDCPTAIASSAATTVAFSLQTTGDLLANRGVWTGFMSGAPGLPGGSTTTFIRLTAARKAVVRFSTTAVTAGKCNVYMSYVQ